MTKVHLKINNIPVEAEPGSTILEAARGAGIQIPTLCYLKDVNQSGACRVCTVEIKGARSLGAACMYPVSEGMGFLSGNTCKNCFLWRKYCAAGCFCLCPKGSWTEKFSE